MKLVIQILKQKKQAFGKFWYTTFCKWWIMSSWESCRGISECIGLLRSTSISIWGGESWGREVKWNLIIDYIQRESKAVIVQCDQKFWITKCFSGLLMSAESDEKREKKNEIEGKPKLRKIQNVVGTFYREFCWSVHRQQM